MYIDHHRMNKEYQKAFDINEQLMRLMHQYHLSPQIPILLTQKAELLLALNRPREAANTYAQAIDTMNAGNHAKLAMQLNELRTLYHLNQVEQQAAKDQLKLRFAQKINFAAAAIALLLIALTLTTYRNAQRMKQKNKGLVKQMRGQRELARKNNLLEKEIDRLNGLITDPEEHNNDDESTYLAFYHLMVDQQWYTNPKLTRPEVADELGISEKALSQLVKKYFGLTFPGYVAHLRLEHAKNMLLESDNETPIDHIREAVGIGSRSTFFRLFKEAYGLSPEELKKGK